MRPTTCSVQCRDWFPHEISPLYSGGHSVYHLVQKLIHHCAAHVYHVPPPAACVVHMLLSRSFYSSYILQFCMYKLVFSFLGVVVLVCVLNIANTLVPNTFRCKTC